LVKLEKDGKKCLCKGTISDFPVGSVIAHERQVELTLNLLLEQHFMDMIPDIHTQSGVVTHLLKLDCFVYPKEEVAGHSTPTKLTGLLPIQVYPLHEEMILLEQGSELTLNNVTEETKEDTLRKRK
jgi:hypothetical protein